jgi:hypothetical protein
MLGFTVSCITGVLVLLSGFFLGTAWAGATPEAATAAASVPVAAGLLSGGGLFLWQRTRILRRSKVLQAALANAGADPGRPARDGLHLFYDIQLILLRSEYEFLKLQGSKSAKLFEESFGLNVSPDDVRMVSLRERWETEIHRRRMLSIESPALGLGEHLAYGVFPREMTVPVELATRAVYLEISYSLQRKRYGRNAVTSDSVPEELRIRIKRDSSERAALTRKL